MVLTIASGTLFFNIPDAVVPHVAFGMIDRLLPTPAVETVHESPKTSVTFLGDLMLARRVETVLHLSGNDSVYSRMPGVSSTSYVVANFEGAIPEQHVKTPELTMSFSIDPVYLDGARMWGVTHFGLANNHSYDKGDEAFHNTYHEIKAHKMVPFGDQHIASTTFTVLQIGTSTVALAGIYAVSVAPDLAALTKQFASYSSTTLQVAYVHWGTEYVPIHTVAQEKLAHELIDLGFDAVIGHHPHVVQDIGVYKDAPIFYSLGNFIFDQYFSTAVQEGLSVSMVPMGQTVAFMLDPFTSVDMRTTPRLMHDFEKSDFLAALAKRSGATLQAGIMEGLLVVPRP